MKNMLKKGMGMLMVFSLLLGVLAVPGQKVEAAEAATKTKNLIIPQGETFNLSTDRDRLYEENWSSNNTKVAKVDKDHGKVTAKKKGKAVITLKREKKTYKVKVTVVAKITKKDVTRVKAGKKQAASLAKYGKSRCAVAFYTKNNKKFQGTLRGIKINSSLNQVVKKYGNISHTLVGSVAGNKECLTGVNKTVLKKMKISGVTKQYEVSSSDGKGGRDTLTRGR